MLLWLQSKLLYFPTHDWVSASRMGAPVEDVWMASTKGQRIHGWWIPYPNASHSLLLCHGNAGNLSHRVGLLRSLRRHLGVNLLIFDYQGYGKSKGSPSEQGTYDDARAAWDFLVQSKKIPPERILVMGRSLGSAVAAHLATQVKPAALILEAPFSSFVDAASFHYPWLPVRWIARFRYTTAAYLTQRSCPLLILHSSQDEIIPYDLGQACFTKANEPKTFVTLRGGHNDAFFVSLRTYLKATKDFLSQHLPDITFPKAGK